MAAPQRFEAFLALGSPRPLGKPPARQLLQVWRFAYQLVLAAPALGRRLIANERFMQRVIAAGAVHREAWTPDDLRAFTALAEPARARASVLLYRTFLAREVGRTPAGRLRVPTRIMVGAGDPAIRPFLLEGAERDAGRSRRGDGARLRAFRTRGAPAARRRARVGPLRTPLI